MICFYTGGDYFCIIAFPFPAQCELIHCSFQVVTSMDITDITGGDDSIQGEEVELQRRYIFKVYHGPKVAVYYVHSLVIRNEFYHISYYKTISSVRDIILSESFCSPINLYYYSVSQFNYNYI